jgi:SAM-dependent methyltransferase
LSRTESVEGLIPSKDSRQPRSVRSLSAFPRLSSRRELGTSVRAVSQAQRLPKVEQPRSIRRRRSVDNSLAGPRMMLEVRMRKTAIAVAILCLAGLALAQTPQMAPMVGPKVWNDIYTNLTARNASFQPNPFLTKVVEGKKPGTALDIGMGQGRNALMLAQRGWDVTGFDISDVAINLAKVQAQKLGLKLNAIVADADTFDSGIERYDLIAAIYVHGAITDDGNQRVLRSLKHGGIMIVEGFHRDALPVGYETNELLRVFSDPLSVLYYEDAIGQPDGTWKDPAGKDLRFVRLVARKE